jgi:RNA polymerase sigma-70 factor (ECF subfamily)
MSLPQPDDAELIGQARSGNDEAFAQLVIRHTPALYRVVRRIANDSAEAEAIVQEAFLRVWRNLQRYRTGRPFFPYLVTIAMNLARDQWRSLRRLDFDGLEPVLEGLADPEPGPEAQLEKAETIQTLVEAVAQLPPAYRTVIALRYDAELSYQEIAEALNLPVNTVRTHLRRAKAFLKQHLSNQDRENSLPQPVEEYGG